jgi:hypothetical protein
LAGEAAGAAAHDFGGALGTPEEDFCSNDQHEGSILGQTR